MWLICSFMVRDSGTMLTATLIRSSSRHFPARELGFGHRRDHALLDFGAGPADGELRQLRQVERRRIHAAPPQVNLEDLDALVVQRQIDEKDLVEAAFADHFGGQQVDAVGGGGHEQAARLLLHPGEEEREDAALLAARFGGRDAHFDFVEPEDRGRHVFHHLAGCTNAPSGLPCRPEKISIMSMR